MKVTKKDGGLEDYDKDKIINACVGAGAPKRIARIVADQVGEKVYDRIATSEIRKLVLEALERQNPEWVENWKEYEKSK